MPDPVPGASLLKKRSSGEATNPTVCSSSQCPASVMSCPGRKGLPAPCWVIDLWACPDLPTKYPWTDGHGMGAARPRPLRTDYAGDTRKGSAASRGDEWGWREAESALTGGYKLLSSLQKARVPESSAFPTRVCWSPGGLVNCGFRFSRSRVGPEILHVLLVPSDVLILQTRLWVAKP